jgi:hypothetical protein
MKTNRKYRMLASALALLLAAMTLVEPDNSFARAKDCKHRIGGRVTRSSNSGPVPERRVEVHLFNGQGEFINTVRTDNDGYYVFADLCPGTYKVRPGPRWLENMEGPILTPMYTPSSRNVTVPTKINSVISPTHIDFRRNEPPPPGEPPEEREEKGIKIDESTREGRDMELAVRVEHFLEATLPCKGPRRCNLTIKVRNGQVELSGIIDPEDRPLVEKVREKVQGVRSLNLGKLRSSRKS